jgi:hypothetical protein
MIIILKTPATPAEVAKAAQDYQGYLKLTIDIEKEIAAIGGEYHADAEAELLRLGCLQANLWGGGLDLASRKFETNAIINLRGQQNPSTEILDAKIREKFLKIAKAFLGDYEREK